MNDILDVCPAKISFGDGTTYQCTIALNDHIREQDIRAIGHSAGVVTWSTYTEDHLPLPEKIAHPRHYGERYTHQGWIGVDLDGTLAAHYWPQDGAYDPRRIGEPIAPMVKRVQAWLADGREVRIFTARVGPNGSAPGHLEPSAAEMREIIAEWCAAHIGVALEATCVKMYEMTEMWDDRAVRVIADRGIPCCNHHVYGER